MNEHEKTKPPGIYLLQEVLVGSGQRDSNARHSPWQGDALPLSYARTHQPNTSLSDLSLIVNLLILVIRHWALGVLSSELGVLFISLSPNPQSLIPIPY